MDPAEEVKLLRSRVAELEQQVQELHAQLDAGDEGFGGHTAAALAISAGGHYHHHGSVGRSGRAGSTAVDTGASQALGKGAVI